MSMPPWCDPSISIHALLAESDICSCSCVGRNRNFYPRSPCGERQFVLCVCLLVARFLSTLSLRRATLVSLTPIRIKKFLSTLSLRRATCHHISKNAAIGFLSTLSLRRATWYHPLSAMQILISIHALLAESDRFFCRALQNKFPISIHALLAESDLPLQGGKLLCLIFLSTLSLRRATNPHPEPYYHRPISIHALLAESDGRNSQNINREHISIHALLAESDIKIGKILDYTANFYPRSPCGERPLTPARISSRLLISIHALLAESDLETFIILAKQLDNFYPRSPCGERPIAAYPVFPMRVFLSTLSLRRATCGWCGVTILNVFLSTLSLRRATTAAPMAALTRCTFLSTLSLRRATVRYRCGCCLRLISIHALLAESDKCSSILSQQRIEISIHALLAESDLARALFLVP